MKTLIYTEKEQMESVIAKCRICFVGMSDIDGTPYVTPMNYGYKEGVLYLHSAPEGRTVSIIEHNPRVSIAFSTDHELVYQHPEVACSYRTRSQSVIIKGTVTFIEDLDKKREVLDILMEQYTHKKFTYSDPAVINVKIWAVNIESMTGREFGAPHY